LNTLMVEIDGKGARRGASALPAWDTLQVMGRILVVEDETDLNDLIARQLRQDGHEVHQAYDGLAGLQTVESTGLDLVILDWMLPKLDGLVVARRIRERHVVPILMLTARGEETDIVLGLEVGADDYLTKPFRIRELLARVRAILRRVELHKTAPAAAQVASPPLLEVGQISLSLEMRTAKVGDEELDLTPKEFDLLTMFVQNPGRAFSRDFLLERIWGDDVFVTDRTVDTHVQRLRKKLGDQADLIRTVWGIGYKLQREG
jgi:DNA-binding response OmpR family regulator